MEIQKNILLNKKNIILSGNHCSGKSLLASYLKCFKGLEILTKNPIYGAVASLYLTKNISTTTAEYLLNVIINNNIFSKSLGRDINMRIGDESSLFNYNNPREYLKRIFSKKKYTYKNNYNIYDIHNFLLSFDLWTKIFVNPKIIQIERHPIDVVESCFRRKLFYFKEKKYRQNLIFKKNNALVPHYLYNIKKQYNTSIDVTIETVNEIIRNSFNTFEKLNTKNKKNILIINFEKFKSNPRPYIIKIKNFLKIKIDKKLLVSLEKKEIIDHKKIISRRINSLKKIKRIASAEQLLKLNNISKKYEKFINNYNCV